MDAVEQTCPRGKRHQPARRREDARFDHLEFLPAAHPGGSSSDGVDPIAIADVENDESSSFKHPARSTGDAKGRLPSRGDNFKHGRQRRTAAELLWGVSEVALLRYHRSPHSIETLACLVLYEAGQVPLHGHPAPSHRGCVRRHRRRARAVRRVPRQRRRWCLEQGQGDRWSIDIGPSSPAAAERPWQASRPFLGRPSARRRGDHAWQDRLRLLL